MWFERYFIYVLKLCIIVYYTWKYFSLYFSSIWWLDIYLRYLSKFTKTKINGKIKQKFSNKLKKMSLFLFLNNENPLFHCAEHWQLKRKVLGSSLCLDILSLCCKNE